MADSARPSKTNRRGNAFSREFRLRTAGDYAQVYNAGEVAADDVLVVRGSAARGGRPRLGLTVSRKVGNAVVRNQWKRRIREAFRLTRSNLPPLDLVVRPRKGAVLDFQAIRRSLPALARRVEAKLKRGRQGGASQAGRQRGRRR